MAKSKNKSRSEAEFLKGKVRQLKRQLRECQKSKGIEIFEEEPVEDVSIVLCELCGKGSVTEIDLDFIVIRKCDHCEFRQAKKKKINR